MNARLRASLQQVAKNRSAYLFIFPSFAFFLLFVAYPLVDTFVISFQNVLGQTHSWAGLANYRQMFDDPVFAKALKHTAFYVVLMVPGGVLLAVTLAGLITFIRSRKMQSLFRAAFYLPIATVSSVMLALVWTYIYDPTFGLLNYLLRLVGLPPQLWLNNPHIALISLVIMMHTQWWGGMIILLVASIHSIPGEIFEAGRLDGAGSFRQFVHITVPLIRPAMAYVAVMATISAFRIFNEIDVMTQGGPAFSTINIAYDIYQTGISEFDFGPAAAFSTVLLLVTIAVAVVQYKFVNEQVD